MLPALTAAVSALFTIAVAMRYARSQRVALLAWSVGLGMFTVAALAGALAQNGGASETEYRVFYLFGGIANVAWLALGTILLVTPRFGVPALVLVLLLS